MTTITDELTGRLDYLRHLAPAVAARPEAFELDSVMNQFACACGALEAVLELAAKHEHGALLPEWVAELRAAVSQWVLGRTG